MAGVQGEPWGMTSLASGTTAYTPAYLRFRPVGLPPDSVIDAFDTHQPRTVMFPPPLPARVFTAWRGPVSITLPTQAYEAAFNPITGGHPLEEHGGPRDGTITYTNTGGLHLTGLDEELNIVTHALIEPGLVAARARELAEHYRTFLQQRLDRMLVTVQARQDRLTGDAARTWVMDAALRSSVMTLPLLGGLGAGTDGRTPPVRPVGKDGLVVAGREGMLAVMFMDDAIALAEFAWTLGPQHDPAFRLA